MKEDTHNQLSLNMMHTRHILTYYKQIHHDIIITVYDFFVLFPGNQYIIQYTIYSKTIIKDSQAP